MTLLTFIEKLDSDRLKGADSQYLNEVAKTIYNQAHQDINDKGTKSSKQEKISMLFDSFVYLVECGLDINSIVEKNYMWAHTWWYALIRLAELSIKNEKSYQTRYEYIADKLERLSNLELIALPLHGRCLTGWACIAESWGVAGNLLNIDTHIEDSIPNIYTDTIIESRQSTKIDLALEFMNALWENVKDIDRIGDQVLNPQEDKEVVRSYFGCSPLIIASAFTNIEQASWLILKGADVNRPDILTGATPIYHVLNKKLGIGNDGNRKRAREMLDLLFQHGTDINYIPNTGEDFWRQLIDSKSLKGKDRDYYKQYFKKNKVEKTALKDIKKEITFSLSNEITPEDIRHLDRRTDFLCFPNVDLLIVLVGFLFEKGVKKFTAYDICTILSQGWNGLKSEIYTGVDGVTRRSCRRDLREKNVVEALGRLMVKKGNTVLATKDIHIERDNEQDIYRVFGNTLDSKVIDNQ